MAMDALGILTSITAILLIGLLVSILSSRLKIPDVLLLILVGIGIGAVEYEGAPLVQFPVIFLTSISILALATIIFDSTSKLKLREFDVFSVKAFKLAFIFLLANVLVLSVLTKYLFGIPIGLGLLFASIMMGTAPEITLSLLSGAKQKTIEILKLESIVNTPLTVLFPFLLLDLMQKLEFTVMSAVIGQIGPFLAKFAAGIGSGVLVGIVLFKVLKRKFSQTYTPLTIIVSALLAYVLAENIGGSGVLAVTTLGLFVGNIYTKQKIHEVLTFESILAKSLFILVFVLIGVVIQIPIEKQFFTSAGILFAVYVVIRYVSVALTLRGKKSDFTFKEKLFMTLNMPKGIAVAVVAFTLAAYNIPGTPAYIPGIRVVLDLTLLFMVATIALSAISMFFAKALVGEAPQPQK
ncbi:cation:proton antiporter [Candidatus Woesearchaeota archaeon]|nr:cation:proton antiporter [Candidatus Woesearchaeota archaeon]